MEGQSPIDAALNNMGVSGDVAGTLESQGMGQLQAMLDAKNSSSLSTPPADDPVEETDEATTTVEATDETPVESSEDKQPKRTRKKPSDASKDDTVNLESLSEDSMNEKEQGLYSKLNRKSREMAEQQSALTAQSEDYSKKRAELDGLEKRYSERLSQSISSDQAKLTEVENALTQWRQQQNSTRKAEALAMLNDQQRVLSDKITTDAYEQRRISQEAANKATEQRNEYLASQQAILKEIEPELVNDKAKFKAVSDYIDSHFDKPGDQEMMKSNAKLLSIFRKAQALDEGTANLKKTRTPPTSKPKSRSSAPRKAPSQPQKQLMTADPRSAGGNRHQSGMSGLEGYLKNK